MQVQLTQRHRKIIKKVVKMQLQSLRAILKDECGHDIELLCLKRQVERSKMEELTIRNIEAFEMVELFPHTYLELPDIHMESFKDVLVNYIPFSRQREEIYLSIQFQESFFNPN